MRTIDRYIAATVGIGFLAAAAMLLPLFGFLDLIAELDDVGEGSYKLSQALLVTMMLLPRRAVELGPFIALLGGIVGMGQLSVNSELTAMRAAGLTVTRIAMPALGAGLALALGLAAADQYVVSPMQQKALQQRKQAVSGMQDQLSGNVLWVRTDRQILRVGELRAGRVPVDVEVFTFAEDDSLQEYIHAARADVSKSGGWLLYDVQIKHWTDKTTIAEHMDQMNWQSIISAKRLDELVLPTTSLSPRQLYRYVNDLHRMGQPAAAYEVALWQKIGAPILTAAMILLAVPFTLSSGRDLALGGRLILGAASGLAVYLANQVAGATAVLFELSPPLAGVLPATVMLVLTLLLLRRPDLRPG
jgi:lipopolysaccharide export system permease protein